MNYRKLRTELEDVLAGKHDRLFMDVINSVHCMSRPRVYAVINAIVSCMDEGEVYLEVGTYQGGSLISALLNNSSRAIGVDAFSEFKDTNNFERTRKNLIDFGVSDRVVLHNKTYQQFFSELPAEAKFQVYYYDGQHDYEGQLAGMETAWNFLQPGSLILVDDYSYREVREAVTQFLYNHQEHIGVQFVMAPMGDFENVGEIWWNGCVVLRVF
jgi:predicted O-methyltransferase YrrM